MISHYVVVVAAGVIASIAACALAVFVYFAAPRRLMNRTLAVALLLEAIVVGTFIMGAFPLDAPTARGTSGMNWVAGTAVCWTYLLFLTTLDAPIVRPFQRPAIRFALGAIAASMLGVVVAFPAIVDGDPTHPASLWAWLMFPISFLLGFIVAVSAYRHARAGSLAKARAKLYVIAFGTRDILYSLLILGVVVQAYDLLPLAVYQVGIPVTALLFVILFGYGILKSQLFDIDLKIKRGISRGTVAAAFLLVFLVVAQLAQNFLSDALGWAAGGIAAGALLFAAVPLQRAAERVAGAAMPKVQATDEYLSYRKIEVYKATVEEIASDGKVTDKDRGVLARLRGKLELGEETARAIERDVFAAKGVA